MLYTLWCVKHQDVGEVTRDPSRGGMQHGGTNAHCSVRNYGPLPVKVNLKFQKGLVLHGIIIRQRRPIHGRYMYFLPGPVGLTCCNFTCCFLGQVTSNHTYMYMGGLLQTLIGPKK